MDKFITKSKDILNKSKTIFDKHIGIEGLIRGITFAIPVIAIIIKTIMFQGFVVNDNPHMLDFNKGYSSLEYFIGYYIAFPILIFSFALLFKAKGRLIYLITADVIITILLLVDVCYFRGFLTLPSVISLNQTGNLGSSMLDTVKSLISIYDLLFLVDFVILGLFIFFTRNLYKKVQRRATISFAVLLIGSFCYVAYLPFNVFILKNEDVKNAYILSGYDPTDTAMWISPIGYHIFDVYKVYKDSQPYTLTEEENSKINKFYEMKQENLPDNEYAGMMKNKNLLVIQVESLESFVMGKEINGKKITPVMDELIKEGLYFPNVYEQVNEGTSSDSDLMVNTSMFPLRRGSTFFCYPNTTYNSLPTLLEEQGYSTHAIHPDKGSFWNYVGGLNGIGFDKFTDEFSFKMDEVIGMGLSDNSYFKQIVPLMKESKKPFYTFTVTLTNHGPFDLPDNYRELDLDDELGANELGGYFESVKYTDKAIGELLKMLDKEGLLEDTMIVIEGDHTGVHKYYNNSIEKLSKKEDWYMDTGEPTIPFIIWSKDMKSPKTFDTIGGQVDIMPTLLYLLGVPTEKYSHTALGRNLLNTNKSFAVLNKGEFRGEGIPEEEKKLYIDMLELSDKMIRSNYFKK